MRSCYIVMARFKKVSHIAIMKWGLIVADLPNLAVGMACAGGPKRQAGRPAIPRG